MLAHSALCLSDAEKKPTTIPSFLARKQISSSPHFITLTSRFPASTSCPRPSQVIAVSRITSHAAGDIGKSSKAQLRRDEDIQKTTRTKSKMNLRQANCCRSVDAMDSQHCVTAASVFWGGCGGDGHTDVGSGNAASTSVNFGAGGRAARPRYNETYGQPSPPPQRRQQQQQQQHRDMVQKAADAEENAHTQQNSAEDEAEPRNILDDDAGQQGIRLDVAGSAAAAAIA
jgi:hypothetical protein